VRSGSFGKVFSLPVDGQIHAQPRYLQNLAVATGKPRNVVYVCTMHNNVQAFDAETPGTHLWSVNLGTALPTSKYSNEIQGVYTDILPDNGILGTPVIDAGRARLTWWRRYMKAAGISCTRGPRRRPVEPGYGDGFDSVGGSGSKVIWVSAPKRR
jgi:hypothetical protein